MTRTKRFQDLTVVMTDDITSKEEKTVQSMMMMMMIGRLLRNIKMRNKTSDDTNQST